MASNREDSGKGAVVEKLGVPRWQAGCPDLQMTDAAETDSGARRITSTLADGGAGARGGDGTCRWRSGKQWSRWRALEAAEMRAAPAPGKSRGAAGR